MSFANRFGVMLYDYHDTTSDRTILKNTKITITELIDASWVKCVDSAGNRYLVPKTYIDGTSRPLSGRASLNEDPRKLPTRVDSSTAQPEDNSPANGGQIKASVDRATSIQSEATAAFMEPAPTPNPNVDDNPQISTSATQHTSGTKDSKENGISDALLPEVVLATEESESAQTPAKRTSSIRRTPSLHGKRASIDQDVADRDAEIDRLRAELNEKDALLDEMDSVLKERALQQEELLTAMLRVADEKRECLLDQLEEKEKQNMLLQNMLDETLQRVSDQPPSARDTASTEAPADKPLHYDFLMAVLKERDELVDKLHDVTTELTEVKVALGTSEFEREKALAAIRSNRKSMVFDPADVVLVDPDTDNYKRKLAEATATIDMLTKQCDELRNQVSEMQRAEKPKPDEANMSATRKEIYYRDELNIAKEQKAQLEIKLKEQAQQLQALREAQATTVPTNHIDPVVLEQSQKALAFAQQENTQHRDQIQALTSKLEEQNAMAAEYEAEIRELASQMHDSDKAVVTLNAQIADLECKVIALEAETLKLRHELEMKDAQLHKQTSQQNEDRAKLASNHSQMAELRQQLDMLNEEARLLTTENAKYSKIDVQLNALTEELQLARQQYAASQDLLAEAKQRWSQEQSRRRALHNTLMELNGNIRVHFRMRPVLDVDRQAGDVTEIMRAIDNQEVEVSSLIHSTHTMRFEFDRVYNMLSTSVEIATEVAPLMTSLLDGFNVCIMAYGQTGSGKTHTMLGKPRDDGVPDMTGIVPACVTDIFRLVDERKQDAQHAVTISVLEVYNNNIRDLLGEKQSDKLEVGERNGLAEVIGASHVPVDSTAAVLQYVAKGIAARTERSTDLNEHSSRSHLIITVYVTVTSTKSDRPGTYSRLHLVDLAGSESVKLSNAVGEGVTEAKNINKSLSSLHDVLLALQHRKANSAQHIPYRNTRLTHLLKDSIGGDAKTLMIVCASPTARFHAETVHSLRFAERARAVQKDAATKRTIPATPVEAASKTHKRTSSDSTSATQQQASSAKLPVKPTRLRGSNADIDA